MTVLGILLAYLLERTAAGRGYVAETLLLLLFAVPGTVFGVALILLWNRPALTAVYASAGIILIGYAAHYTPLAALAIRVSLRAISAGVEDAARVAGVPWTRMMRGVLLPLLAPAAGTAWALTFVFCLRDLDLVMTLHPPGFETLPTRLYTLMANSADAVTAALAIVMVVVTVVSVLMAASARALLRRIARCT